MNILYKSVYALFVLALVAVALLFLATMLPIPGNVEVKIVKSGSMEPAIPTGSIVVVKPATNYAVGDVITFGRDTKQEIPTTHRIVEVQGGGATYLTKGDANEEADPRTILKSDIIGSVFVHVPYVGYILDFARQPWGFTLMIGIPAALIILDELIRIVAEVQKMYRKRADEDEITEAFKEEPAEPQRFNLPQI